MMPSSKKVRIESKTLNCIFIGYAYNSSAYQFIVYESQILDIHKKTIIESRNASLFEHVFLLKSKEEASSSKREYETQEEE